MQNNFKSIIIGSFLAILILFAGIVTISIVYEEEVSLYLVEELNEYILSEIEVEDLNFSLLKKFPKASLELKNITAYTKSGYLKKINGLNTDTLFSAKSIYIQLNIKDILSQNYNIKSIHFDEGKINLFIDRFGDPNYIFWEKKQENKNKEFNVELKELKITGTQVLFYNEATDILTKSYINKMDFKGNFSKENYLMKIKSNLFVEDLSVDKISYIQNKNIKTNLGLDIIGDNIKFRNGNITFENLKFLLNGDIVKTKNRKIDLMISGKNLNLKSFLENLPVSIKKEFSSISSQKGLANINLSISGENLKLYKPHIKAIYGIENADLFDNEREILFENITINGEFDNGKQNKIETSSISFKSFYTEIGKNHFKGDFSLYNLKNPFIKLNMETGLYLEEIKETFKLDTFDIFKGKAEAKIKYSGEYQDLKEFQFSHLFTDNYFVDLKIKGAEAKLQDMEYSIMDISGNFKLKNTLNTDSLYFKIGQNDFLLSGRISKLFEYLNDKEVFNVNAKIYSQKINLDQLAYLFKKKETEDSQTSYKFPDKLSLQLRLNIENFEAGKFNAMNIKGSLNYKPRMFSLHEISFNSMNGNIKAGGVIIQKYNNNFFVKSQSRLANIDISDMFYSLNNFGQSFITNKNLDGSLNGKIYFTSEWSDNLKVEKKSVIADGDIVINQGELNDFEPMEGLSKFIDIEELRKIKFSTIKNKITIQDEKIIIPQMDIESSVLNLKASGEHFFDNSYTYHAELLLSDLLSGKMKRKNKNKIGNIEEDDEGRITLYLLLEGDEKKSRIKYDRKAAREIRKAKMREEKKEFKSILNEEFGWFKKDSTINKPSTQKDKFKIEFEENKKKQEKKNNKSEQKFVIEWEEDSTLNN